MLELIIFIKKNKTEILLGIIVILLLALGISITIGNNYKNEMKVSNHNITALMDTLTSVRLKNNELLQYKNSLIIEKEELEKYMDISKNDIKVLEKQLNEKVKYISVLEGKAEIGETQMEVNKTETNDSINYRYLFNETNEYFSISGFTDVDNNHNSLTTITSNVMNLKLKVGLDDDWKIFVKTDNPYVSFNSIDGALLDKSSYIKDKKKITWSFCGYLGFGIQYGLINKQLDVGPQLGGGVSVGIHF